MRQFILLLVPLAAVANCASYPGGPTDEGLGGAGGAVQTGGGPHGSGGLGEGGAGPSGGSGGSALGGSGGASNPEDAFITVWETNPALGGEWTTSSPDDEIHLPLAADGTYDMVVDWGDDTTTNITGPEDPDRVHEYGEPGTYVVSMRGHIEGWQGFPTTVHETGCDSYGYDCSYEYESDWPKLRELRQWGTFRFGDVAGAFSSCTDLIITATDMPDLSPPVTLENAFVDCSNLDDIPSVGDWDVTAVTNMSGLWKNTSFDGDVSTWDTSKVQDMGGMFSQAASFNGDLSAWDTSSVEHMWGLFSQTSSFNGDLSNWDTSSVTEMNGMFFAAPVFNGDLSNWDTSSVTQMQLMFWEAAAFSGDLSAWDTSAVTNMNGMFEGAAAFNADLSAWNTSSVTDMGYMFHKADLFDADLSGWDTGSVTDMGSMFRNAAAFDRDLSAWDVGALESADYMLSGSGLSTANYDALLIAWAAQETQTGVDFGAQGIQYSAAAAAARAVLTQERGWTISDGGLAP